MMTTTIDTKPVSRFTPKDIVGLLMNLPIGISGIWAEMPWAGNDVDREEHKVVAAMKTAMESAGITLIDIQVTEVEFRNDLLKDEVLRRLAECGDDGRPKTIVFRGMSSASREFIRTVDMIITDSTTGSAIVPSDCRVVLIRSNSSHYQGVSQRLVHIDVDTSRGDGAST